MSHHQPFASLEIPQGNSSMRSVVIGMQAGHRGVNGHLSIHKKGAVLSLKEGVSLMQRVPANTTSVFRAYSQGQDQLVDLKLNIFMGNVTVWVQ